MSKPNLHRSSSPIRIISSTSDSLGILAPGSNHVLQKENFNYVVKVRRAETGTPLEIFDVENSTWWAATTEKITGNSAHVKITAKLRVAEPTVLAVHLIVGAFHGSRCDTMIEQLVEIGVHSITFFNAERSQGRDNKFESRVERYTRIGEAAIQQCGGSLLPRYQHSDTLESALKVLHTSEKETARFVCLSPIELRQTPDLTTITPLRELCLSFEAKNAHNSSRLAASDSPLQNPTDYAEFYLIIGPEGGLAPREIETAVRYGYQGATLGTSVLRIGTAAVVAAALVRSYR